MNGVFECTEKQIEEMKQYRKKMEDKGIFDIDEYKLRFKFKAANIPEIMWDKKINDLREFKDRNLILVYIKNFKLALQDGAGIYFHGSYGVGKTFTACIIAMEAIRQNYSVYYIAMPDFISTLSKTYNDRNAEDKFNIQMEETDFLILDELGREYTGVKNQLSPMITLKLDSILRHRINNNKSTIITTNIVNLDDLKQLYSDSILSCIIGACEMILIEGKDQRIAGSEKKWKNIN